MSFIIKVRPIHPDEIITLTRVRTRICRRCDKPFRTLFKRAKTCENCRHTPIPKIYRVK